MHKMFQLYESFVRKKRGGGTFLLSVAVFPFFLALSTVLPTQKKLYNVYNCGVFSFAKKKKKSLDKFIEMNIGEMFHGVH